MRHVADLHGMSFYTLSRHCSYHLWCDYDLVKALAIGRLANTSECLCR